MKIILLLVIRYMKQNKRRTIAVILGIITSVFMFTIVTIFTASFTRAMERSEIEENGAWHAIFHNITEEQAGEITSWNKVKKSSPVLCEAHEGSLCQQIEMKRPGITAIGSAQKFAEKIGMDRLPEEEWHELTGHEKIRYDVTYHMELLEYHGVFSQGSSGPGAMAASILILMVVFFSIFIYNAFAVSAFEKMRYIGMLGSAGATRFQKSSCILLEGALEGLIAVPIGLGLGIAAASLLVQKAAEHVFYNPLFTFQMGIKEIGLILLCSVILILTSSMIPASRAGNATITDLLIRAYPEKMDGHFLNARASIW